MMRCKEMIEKIEAAYPKEAALSFDHVGLQVGRTEKEVERIYLALDATEDVINDAIASHADLIVTHHPLLFHPLERITADDFIGGRVWKLIQNDISYYACHTNYDVLGMAGLAEQIFELQNARVLDVTMEKEQKEEGIGRIGMLKKAMTLRECCGYVKNRLKLDTVKVFGDPEKEIHCFAVSPGSGKSAVAPAVRMGADVLVTGDIGHHEGIDAQAQGLAVIDAGHYGTEAMFLEDMKQFLKKQTEGSGIDILTAPVRQPFYYV